MSFMRTMRHILTPLRIASLAAAVLAVSACDGDPKVRISGGNAPKREDGVLKVVETLQCPQTQGQLTRKGSARAGGTICTYTGPRGAEVALHLVPLEDQTPAQILARFEAMLKDGPGSPTLLAPQAPPEPPTPPEPPRPPADEATQAAQSEGRQSVRLPGIHIESSGENASVQIGKFHIQADEGSGDVDVSSSDEQVSIRARDDGAEIRTRAAGSAVRSTYILTDETPTEGGWRMVGYEARGPSGGPLIIATVRSKDRDDDSLFDDAKDLVALNVGD